MSTLKPTHLDFATQSNSVNMNSIVPGTLVRYSRVNFGLWDGHLKSVLFITKFVINEFDTTKMHCDIRQFMNEIRTWFELSRQNVRLPNPPLHKRAKTNETIEKFIFTNCRENNQSTNCLQKILDVFLTREQKSYLEFFLWSTR